MKKGIVRCQQHQVKSISSDSDAYREEMISLRDNLHRNNYSESITSATSNLNRTTENCTRKNTTICRSYFTGQTEKILKMCGPFDIRTIFMGGMTLRKYLSKVKPPPTIWPKIYVYSIPWNCGQVYKVETCSPHKVRLEEYQKAVLQDEFEKTGNLWKEKRNHLSLWDEVKITDRKDIGE